MFHRLLTIVLILIGVVASGTETALAAEFKLGSRFQDTDGDMVADTPSDPCQADGSEHVDLCLYAGRGSFSLR